MPMPESKKYGCYSAYDSGVPHNSRDYTTLIIFHGLAFHSVIFEKLFSVLGDLNVRLVAANRPGYPGATPLTDKEQMQLNDIATIADQDSESAANSLLDYVKGDAVKTRDFLVEFISRENIPLNGGIVLAGWSYGTTTVLGFLANANTVSSSKDFDLRSYIKHVIFYDSPSLFLGYAPPANAIGPLNDPSLTFDEAVRAFPLWVSTYYALNDDPTKLGYEAVDHPPPTMLSMDPLDVQRCLEIGPVSPGGSDEQFFRLGVRLGVLSWLREAALYFNTGRDQDLRVVNMWDDVEIKHIWCDQSVWEIPWAAVCLQAELDNAKKYGKPIRKVNMLRLSGSNHFCHWDQPEVALKALLSGLNLVGNFKNRL